MWQGKQSPWIFGEKPPEDPKPGATSIRMGAAVLRPSEEKGHYALYRPMVIVRNEDGKITREQLDQEVGPLAIYREKRNGDVLQTAMKTSDPKTGRPMELVLVWKPGMD